MLRALGWRGAVRTTGAGCLEPEPLGGPLPGAPRMPGAGWWPREAQKEQSKHSTAGPAPPLPALGPAVSPSPDPAPGCHSLDWRGGTAPQCGSGPSDLAWLSRPAWPGPSGGLEPCFALFVGQAQLCYWR